jgi:hypothetical protein
MGEYDEYIQAGGDPYEGFVSKELHESTDTTRAIFADGPGKCPECGGRIGPVSIGSDYWQLCDEHQKMWCVGIGLSDAWKQVTPEQQRETLDRVSGYEVVPANGRDRPISAGEKAAHTRLEAVLDGA